MIPLNPTNIAFLAVIANILVQAVKGLLPESFKRYLPIVIMLVMAGVGAGLAFYTGRDPVAGALEGFFAGASAVGLYEGASQLPILGQVFNSSGWLQKRDGGG